MRTSKFFLVIAILGLVGGCGESWQEPTEVKLVDGKIIRCEKGMYLDTNKNVVELFCYGEQGVKTIIPWKQVIGLQKNLPIDTAKK